METNLSATTLVRIAHLIRRQLFALRLSRAASVLRQADHLLDNVGRLQTARRKLSICLDRNWGGASRKVLDQLESSVRDLPYYASQIQQACQGCDPKVPSVREVVEDLQQLRNEFGQVQFASKEQALAVVTDAIELEDVYLGEFEIRLHIDRLGEPQRGSVYSITALDPHPAASNGAVTHPHVSDERLCAGDAGAAIQSALASGRICDFFLLVRSVLTTYSPSSPYVSLDKWAGTPCRDCGYVMDSEDTRWCPSCEHDFCDECSSCCSRCDEAVCNGCLVECRV